MNMYRAIADRIGTLRARDLADQLVEWHDAMVKHVRLINVRGGSCIDGCPHEEARLLWATALEVFGDHAAALVFLRTHGAGMPPVPANAARAGLDA